MRTRLDKEIIIFEDEEGEKGAFVNIHDDKDEKALSRALFNTRTRSEKKIIKRCSLTDFIGDRGPVHVMVDTVERALPKDTDRVFLQNTVDYLIQVALDAGITISESLSRHEES